MNGNCHFLVGGATSFMALEIIYHTKCLNSFPTAMNSPPYFITCFAATCLIGSIFPDIDNPRSHIGQLSKPLSSFIYYFSKKVGNVRQHHRGVFHDPILYLIGLFFSASLFSPLIGFFIGALSHLFLDAQNPEGIRLLGTKYIGGKIVSSSKSAIVFSNIVCMICLVIGFCFQFQNTIERILAKCLMNLTM